MTNDNALPPGLAGPSTDKLIRSDRCECCKFSERMPGTDPRFECHRYPPHASSFLAPGASGGATIASNSAYPICFGTHWCGEWKPKVLQ